MKECPKGLENLPRGIRAPEGAKHRREATLKYEETHNFDCIRFYLLLKNNENEFINMIKF